MGSWQCLYGLVLRQLWNVLWTPLPRKERGGASRPPTSSCRPGSSPRSWAGSRAERLPRPVSNSSKICLSITYLLSSRSRKTLKLPFSLTPTIRSMSQANDLFVINTRVCIISSCSYVQFDEDMLIRRIRNMRLVFKNISLLNEISLWWKKLFPCDSCGRRWSRVPPDRCQR